MRDNVVYNKWDNEVMVKTAGEYIYIICHNEEQVEPVMNRMTTDTCFLSDYEDEDMKWILTFKVLEDFEQLPEKN